MKKEIRTQNASTPVGIYSQAIGYKDLIFISGQIPLTKKGEKVEGSMTEKMSVIMENIHNILKEANSDFDKVVYCQIYLKNIEDFDEVNEIYKDYFKKPYPARVVVGGVKLPAGADIEITMVAHR